MLSAQAMKKDGDLEGAIDMYKQAALIDPSSALLQTEIGSFTYSSGQHDSAEPHLKKAAELDPGYPDTYVYLAELYTHLNLPDAAARTTGKPYP